ncbi:4698_t:CDS:2 [Ambispora gerdemannii]|uniref:4698_t:CDS:1 n=1 Tax=Ambispora gerdemannii TaxID=144530 RepID=A0A9N8V9D1_9GLOM|nr:4698_t:CDS:2 [Ambispora gerdemannii]
MSSDTLASLKSKRKGELKELAVNYGLSTKGLRIDIENRIREYILERQKDSDDTDVSTGYSGEGDSEKEVKQAESSSGPPSPVRPSSRAAASSPHKKTNGDSRSDYSSESFDKQEVVKEIAVGTSFNGSTPHGRTIETSDDHDVNFSVRTFSFETVNEGVIELRRYVTNTRAFVIASIALQIAVFLYVSIEWTKFATIPIGFLSTETREYSINLRGPDLTILGEWHRFWRPLLVYWGYLVLLPLVFAYVFNFEPHRHAASPLAFSVAQYCILFISAGNLDWVEDVRDFIPETIIYSGAGASVVFAFYEGLLANTSVQI